MIKIIIFSGIRIYCEGLNRILSSQDAIEVVESNDTLVDAVSQIEYAMPDLVLLDMTMSHSCEFAIQIKSSLPQIKIVAIAVPEDEQGIIECAEAGIFGYVAREASIEELIETVIHADKGEFCCPPRIAAAVFNRFQDLAQKAKYNFLAATNLPSHGNIQDLTRREKQILDLMTTGLSNKEIANTLVIEVSTVKNHVHNILVKLEVNSRVQAVAMLQKELHKGRRGSFELGRSGEICP